MWVLVLCRHYTHTHTHNQKPTTTTTIVGTPKYFDLSMKVCVSKCLCTDLQYYSYTYTKCECTFATPYYASKAVDVSVCMREMFYICLCASVRLCVCVLNRLVNGLVGWMDAWILDFLCGFSQLLTWDAINSCT